MMVPRFAAAGLALALAACSGSDTAPKATPAAESRPALEAPTASTTIYECDDYTFTAHYRPGEMALWLRDGQRVLPQVRSGSGVRYSDGEVEFFGKGDEGMLSIGDTQYRDCIAVTKP